VSEREGPDNQQEVEGGSGGRQAWHGGGGLIIIKLSNFNQYKPRWASPRCDYEDDISMNRII